VDKFETVVLECPKFAAVVLGNVDLTEFELLPVGGPTMGTDAADAIRVRGLGFIGVIGLGTDGEFRSALDREIGPGATRAIAHAFTQDVAARAGLLQSEKSDGVEWLHKLFSLQDNRAN
jgi:hypothetical protein